MNAREGIKTSSCQRAWQEATTSLKTMNAREGIKTLATPGPLPF